ncbi:hypothetical protein TWF481_000093 [Arthrobotrys musiformis]|uniref:RBR-type E3 ubiquitin transferase n=1 Tax=Arthrobotrys musiformis TaxID=47236 RepID=A0AAV9WSA4_9PEZI
MAFSERTRGFASKFGDGRKHKKRIERRISEIAVDLKWAQALTLSRSPSASKVSGAWYGRTRATKSKALEDLKRKEAQTFLPKPLARYPQEEETTCFTCESTIPVYKTVVLPCDHIHCHDCLLLNYQTVINCPAGFPPRCCEHLEFGATAFVLSPRQIQQFLAVKARHESRMIVICAYCKTELFEANTSISESVAYCSTCQKLTCVICRKEMHKDMCPQAPGTVELQRIVREAGWSQCPRCSRVIEKAKGCNHIECVCGAGFCSKCGQVIRLYDGLGCLCIERVKANPITFGKSFQPAKGGDASGTQEDYKKLLSIHKRGTAKKARGFAELEREIIASKSKHEDELKLVGEMAELRVQLVDLKENKLLSGIIGGSAMPRWKGAKNSGVRGAHPCRMSTRENHLGA